MSGCSVKKIEPVLSGIVFMFRQIIEPVRVTISDAGVTYSDAFHKGLFAMDSGTVEMVRMNNPVVGISYCHFTWMVIKF